MRIKKILFKILFNFLVEENKANGKVIKVNNKNNIHSFYNFNF